MRCSESSGPDPDSSSRHKRVVCIIHWLLTRRAYHIPLFGVIKLDQWFYRPMPSNNTMGLHVDPGRLGSREELPLVLTQKVYYRYYAFLIQ